MEGHLALDYVVDENGTWATKGAALKWYRKELAEAKRQLEAKQAIIDRLMLEYCPNEMSVEQLVNWSNHQRAIERDIQN